MKNLNNYINEAVEFELIKTEYREYGVVTLVRRENVKCSSLSKEKFVKMILEDLHNAIEEYGKIIKPLNDERLKTYIERDIKQAEAYAEKKWKTQKKRDEYVENAKKNAETKKWYLDDYKRIFFDFKPDKGNMGIAQECILNVKTDEKQLEKCYEEIKNSKYFKKATGWAFKYESHGINKEKPGYYSFRPYVDLLLDETSREEQKRDAETLAQAVKDFYANSNYWGD